MPAQNPKVNRIGKRLVTLQRIADEAKVHVSTVSLAMHNDPRLRPTTRSRIQDVARRLGYSPNPLMAMLMARVRRRSADYVGTLAYLHTVPKCTPLLDSPIHRNYIAGAQRRAGELGYRMDEFFIDGNGMTGQRIAAMMLARSIAGAIIEHTPSPDCPDRKLPFDVGAFAVASLGVPLTEPPLHYVANDQYMRAILAARELLALGYRRIGLVVCDHFDSAMTHRCTAGFWAVQRYTAGLKALPVCWLRGRERRPFERWYRTHRPDVVLATNEFVLDLARECGLEAPRDVGGAILDWHAGVRDVAGVYGNSDTIGAAAVELAVSQIHRGETGPPAKAMSYLVSGSWVPGKTVRRVGPGLDLDTSFFSDLLR